MKICICCSLSFTDEVLAIGKKLEALGHEVLLPNGVINRVADEADFDAVQVKIDTDVWHTHVNKIRASDAVLVCNFTKNGVQNYIGANSFAEIFVAKYFDKPVFALNPLPDQPYINDEIQAFEIEVVDGDLAKIKENKNENH